MSRNANFLHRPGCVKLMSWAHFSKVPGINVGTFIVKAESVGDIEFGVFQFTNDIPNFDSH